MSTRLRLLVISVVAVGTLLLAAALFLFPLPTDPLFLPFWILVTLVASAAPVRLPRGSQASVAGSPVLAAAFLGGPAAAAIVGAIGTFELREFRGGVPWYGTLYNHATFIIPAVAAALVYQAVAGGGAFEASATTLLAAFASGLAFLTLNALLSSAAVAVRTGLSIRSVLWGDIAVIGRSVLAYAPLAWLMAVVSIAVGQWAVVLFGLPLATTRSAYKRVVEIRDMFTQTISSLSSAVDAKDHFTAGHSKRVQEISVVIGRQLRCSEAELEALEWGGLLHDIGKIGVPDAVLLKPDRLTREERVIMNMHPVKGEEIIRPVQRLAPELPIIRHHHEWYNGSGYPDHLVGEGIPKLARILHVADAFEAMTAARPYRMTPLTAEQAMGELRKYAGIQFDPVMVDAFARTHYVAEVADPGRPPMAKPIPLLAQAAALKAGGASTGTGETN
ncbi:MAG: HD domain-containing phosphohydrolase [Actinomycetota bacterium]